MSIRKACYKDTAGREGSALPKQGEEMQMEQLKEKNREKMEENPVPVE